MKANHWIAIGITAAIVAIIGGVYYSSAVSKAAYFSLKPSISVEHK